MRLYYWETIKLSPIIPKKWYGDIPIISYWGVFIGELLEMLRATLFKSLSNKDCISQAFEIFHAKNAFVAFGPARFNCMHI